VSILEQVQARLAELRSEIKASLEQRGALIDKVAAEKRGFTAEEETAYNELGSKRAAAEAQVAPLVEREKELLEQQRSEKLQNETRKSGAAGETGNAQVTDPPVYVADGKNGQSFFRDLAQVALRSDRSAVERLSRNALTWKPARSVTPTRPVVPVESSRRPRGCQPVDHHHP
jgi:hypothetical protein